jgi:predicted heme/steroid binding protein
MGIPLWLAAILGSTGVFLARVDYNLFFMKFFRNLSRSKARARLHGNKFAMIPVMLGIEEPMKIEDDDMYAENAMTVTREQLEGMDGFDGAPLYLSIRGRVYDVSAGSKFYGEGGEYSDWAGRDASRSFGTGCRGGVDRTGMDCLSESLEGLTSAVRGSASIFSSLPRERKAALPSLPSLVCISPIRPVCCVLSRANNIFAFIVFSPHHCAQEMKEIDRWLELYETHDKYTFVGHLVDDPVNDILQHIIEEEEEEEEEEDAAESESEVVGVDDDDSNNSQTDQEAEPASETVEI